MASNAGAIVAELMEDRKLNNDIGRRVVHFRLVGQFLGFAGSSGPAHVTCGVEQVVDKRERFLASCRGTLLTRLGSDEDMSAAALVVG